MIEIRLAIIALTSSLYEYAKRRLPGMKIAWESHGIKGRYSKYRREVLYCKYAREKIHVICSGAKLCLK